MGGSELWPSQRNAGALWAYVDRQSSNLLGNRESKADCFDVHYTRSCSTCVKVGSNISAIHAEFERTHLPLHRDRSFQFVLGVYGRLAGRLWRSDPGHFVL